VIASSIIDLIGDTPIIELKGYNAKHGTLIFGKLESFNPGGSIKDRTGLGLIKCAMESGELKPGMTIVESTSGNLGYSLAILSKLFDFKLICIVDHKTPEDALLFYKAYGVQIEFVDKADSDGGYQKNRIARAREIASQDSDCINLDQYSNPAARDIHYEMTGPEIIAQMEGRLDALVANASTGSHLSGIAQYLKESDQQIQTIAVEPEGSVIFGGEYHPYMQNGSGLSFKPENYCGEYIDTEIKVSDADAQTAAKELIETDGLLIGLSSGAALHAAKGYCQQPGNKFRRCLAIFPDSGVKYLRQ
jgi:cystathionine beta-synthase/cysteine synthase A